MKKITAVILVCVLAFALCGCDSKDYKAAEELYTAGDYAAAAEAYRALGDYEDSAERVKACEYELAQALFEKADYEGGREAFRALGDYADSAEMVSACDWELAQQFFAAEDYAAAVELLEGLGGYADSAALLQSAKDALAVQAYLGEWFAEMDLSEEMTEEMDGMELPPFVLKLYLRVGADQTLDFGVDEENLRENAEILMDAIRGIMKDMVTELLGDMPMDTLLSELGVETEEELLDMLMADSGLTADYFMEEFAMELTGEWAMEEGVMLFTVDGETEEPVLDEAAGTLTMGVGDDAVTFKR